MCRNCQKRKFKMGTLKLYTIKSRQQTSCKTSFDYQQKKKKVLNTSTCFSGEYKRLKNLEICKQSTRSNSFHSREVCLEEMFDDLSDFNQILTGQVAQVLILPVYQRSKYMLIIIKLIHVFFVNSSESGKNIHHSAT